MIRELKKSDYLNFITFCSDSKDFFITKNNQRLFLNNINNAILAFNTCIKHGDKSYILEENGKILGSLLVVGYSDKFERKYLKIFSQDKNVTVNLLRYFTWKHKSECYLKVKKESPLLSLINNRLFSYNNTKKWGFKFNSNRGSEILFQYIPNKQVSYISNFKDEDI
jgi:hypothetical protein